MCLLISDQIHLTGRLADLLGADRVLAGRARIGQYLADLSVQRDGVQRIGRRVDRRVLNAAGGRRRRDRRVRAARPIGAVVEGGVRQDRVVAGDHGGRIVRAGRNADERVLNERVRAAQHGAGERGRARAGRRAARGAGVGQRGPAAGHVAYRMWRGGGVVVAAGQALGRAAVVRVQRRALVAVVVGRAGGVVQW